MNALDRVHKVNRTLKMNKKVLNIFIQSDMFFFKFWNKLQN